MLTGKRLPAKLPCIVYKLSLVTCSFLLSRKFVSNIFCFKSNEIELLVDVVKLYLRYQPLSLASSGQ